MQPIQVPMSVMIMQNDTYFTRKLCRWRTPSSFSKQIYSGPLCLLLITCQNHLGSKLVNLENRNSKTTSSKPAVFSLFVLFLLGLTALIDVKRNFEQTNPFECFFTQGHPTAIFGKYLFGRRFEIQNLRNICCKISCLPASPRIFEHQQNGIITHF